MHSFQHMAPHGNYPLSVLHCACEGAKQIVNRAVINEDPNARMIRELKDELEALRSQVTPTCSFSLYVCAAQSDCLGAA